MIYTVTFNPSLDYIVGMNEFTLGKVNRTNREQILPGGKGINVSIVLKNLGLSSTALGFIAGFTGKEVERRVASEFQCGTDFIEIDNGLTRINVKINNKPETEINGQGPNITEDYIEKLYAKLECLTEKDILVLAGSIPGSMPDTIYEQILERIKSKRCKVIVDATGDLLLKVLKYHPFMIKPNNHELEEIFGVELQTKEQIIVYAKKLQEMGAVNVLVSMAGEGAILVAEDQVVYQSNAPKGKLINSVGAGDSMVAGFITGFLQAQNYRDAFYMGIATGSASAFSEQLATKEDVNRILETLG